MTSLTRKISFSADAIFHAVIQDGDTLELIRILNDSDSPIDINQPNQLGLTPLHQGVLSNNLDAVKLLLNGGADVNAQDVNGFSPLHAAAACGFLQVVSLLVVFGANVFQTTVDKDLPVDLAKDEATTQMLHMEMCARIHQKVKTKSWIQYKCKEYLRIFFNLLILLIKKIGIFFD